MIKYKINYAKRKFYEFEIKLDKLECFLKYSAIRIENEIKYLKGHILELESMINDKDDVL